MKQNKKIRLFTLGVILLLCASLTLSCVQQAPFTVETGESRDPSAPSAPASAEEKLTELEYPHAVATASVGVIGDILIHSTNYESAHRGNGVCDFTENYEFITPYLSKYDYTVANLEVTLGGENPVVGKYPSGYPGFNCPDSVVDALKGAGVDLLLTANNHSYDTRQAGFYRTLQVIREKGLEALGTRAAASESTYTVKNLNGIQIGMACYTYSTFNQNGTKSLNGNPMSAETSALVTSFSYYHLEDFYREAENTIAAMRRDGAEFIMFYMHWGNEYQYKPNSYQKNIAKRLCELGVDVIVGGHPHVIQPFETIVGDNGNETLCIYSTGNAISNQRAFLMDSDNFSGHTEDGMIFGVTFEKWSDGLVRLSEVNIEPMWVIRESRQGRLVYQIIPLDLSVADWKSFKLTDATVKDAKASYNRTMELVASGLNAARAKLGLPAVSVSVS